jgi:hypothetical protein
VRFFFSLLRARRKSFHGLNLLRFVGSVGASEAKDAVEGDLESPRGVPGVDRVFLVIIEAEIKRNIIVLR